jgi:predicted NBD/HSP70 family sugar kinase
MDFVFDAGGTNIRFGASHNGRTLLRTTLLPVPKSYKAALSTFQDAAKEMCGEKRITRICGGVAGPLHPKKTHLMQSTHLPTWARQPLKHDLERIFRCPVCLENDCALVALGEATQRAMKRYSIVAYIGIGTGIGGARIVDGMIDSHVVGFEPGHHIMHLSATTRAHPSPHAGDWETLVSGSAIFARYGVQAHAITKQAVWKEMASLVAVGLVNVTMFWSPEVMILGGSLMKRLPLALIRREYAARQKVVPLLPAIRRARLGDFGGLIGALRLLQTS